MRHHTTRFGGASHRAFLALATALAFAGCAKSPPPPQAAAPPPPPPPQAPVHAVRPVLHATWSFHAASDSCMAEAKAGAAGLTIAIHRTGPIRITLLLAHDPPEHTAARFSGTAGNWDMRAIASRGRTESFVLPRDETSLGRILSLLSGGQFIPEKSELPILALPESGAAGRRWFDCARRSVNGA